MYVNMGATEMMIAIKLAGTAVREKYMHVVGIADPLKPQMK